MFRDCPVSQSASKAPDMLNGSANSNPQTTQTATGSTAAAGGNYATNAGNVITGAGNARASGYMGVANALAGGLQGYINSQNPYWNNPYWRT